MNGYELSRNFTNWAFENPEKIKTIHYAVYFFAIEHCNRLGGKKKFGFPSQMTMEAIGVKKHQTYSKALNDLIEWGFLMMVEKSKNQYSANIISISAVPKKGKARGKALDKAWTKHGAKQGRSTGQSKDNITKPINQQTNKPYTSEEMEIKIEVFLNWFNSCKKKYTGKMGKFKSLTETDKNNFFKLLETYNNEDFKEAIPKLYDSEWARDTNNLTPAHFLRNDNFVKYLNAELKPNKVGLG